MILTKDTGRTNISETEFELWIKLKVQCTLLNFANTTLQIICIPSSSVFAQ